MLERPELSQIPDAPGSYQFFDHDGRVIYVGKAASLRQRIASYFSSGPLPPRTAQMLAAAERLEWIRVRNDVEAFMLEYSLIKEHRPRFNIRLRDDKSYPWLAVTVSERWPRPMVIRGRRRPGVRYFGPYAHAYAIRETLGLLQRSFPLRTCSDAKFARQERLGRPCLLYHIGRCCGPCIGAVTEEAYQRMVGDLCSFLEGDTDELVARLTREMTEAASQLEFEKAARIRDRLAAVHKAMERQEVVTEKPEDFDVLGMTEDELEAAVVLLRVRRGRVVGRRAVVVDKVEDSGPSEVLSRVIGHLYGAGEDSPPPEIYVPVSLEDAEVVEAWLADRAARRVKLRLARLAAKRALSETASANAKEELQRHKAKRAGDHNARARALTSLAEALGMREAPLRIECYDMSHLQGSDYVGSMVVFEDGLPKRSDYRRFKVKTVPGNDDYSAMKEVLRRRLARLREDSGAPKRRFSYPPQLILLDGGKGQLGVGVEALEEQGLLGEIAIAAIAKRFEEVYLPGRKDPLYIPRGSEALYLLQQLRDEAHRFAITYHRRLRQKRLRSSALEEVAGLGPRRRERLLSHFGGLPGLQAASRADLARLSWLPGRVADELYARLHA